MQLTKDEINTIWSDCQDTGNATRESIAAAVIAAHTAKVLEDVEPVNAHAVRAGIAPLVYSPATVAALKLQRDALQARVDALEGVIDSVLLDIDDDGVAEARDIAILAMRNIRNNRPQYEGLVDAAPKGTP